MWPRRWGAVLGVLVVAAAIMLWLGPTRTDVRSSAFDPDVERIVVDVNGRVSVHAGDGTSVSMTREWGWLRAPETAMHLEDGVLRLEGSCGGVALVGGRCVVHADATVPGGAEVIVTTSAGAVDVSGTSGGVDLTSSAGRVEVDDVAGPARLQSSAGAIGGTVAGGDVDADTSAGAITLEITGNVERASARSSAGAVTLTVPDEVYRVDADTSAGDVNLDVRTDPDASRRITARSSAGDITIRRTAPDQSE